MSYYRCCRDGQEGSPRAARVIEELYAAKVQLERDVERISDARDLLMRDNAIQCRNA